MAYSESGDAKCTFMPLCAGVEEARTKLKDADAQEDWFVRPMMLEAEYTAQAKDYTGIVDGVPYLLYMDVNGATVFGPVILVENWRYWQHLKHRSPSVELLEMLSRTHTEIMMCVEEKPETLQMSICDGQRLIRFPAMTKKEIVRHWMMDSFSHEKNELLFDAAVLRLIPDYITSAELSWLKYEFIAGLKQTF
ncbi:hypothetical protein JI735_34430 (plasmid) [Paenibacillus sonchi]|uniref:Uncharacterized protein n=1 Tax=Paenibacillus sonchi TaxID=373687 RepID=A0A974PIC6_9BACL|nr:hypothetical protein [Paenibacillus sonchi]QQZ64534.1 hypothetical protein JI735_34430 [Paenibacillus sonchi]